MIRESGHTARIMTNGYLLPEKAEGLIKAGLDYAQVSIDGPEEVHDSIRGVEGAYRHAIDGIRMLNQAGNRQMTQPGCNPCQVSGLPVMHDTRPKVWR